MPEYATYRDAIASIELGNVLDWWNHAGMPAGEPKRQTTWGQIERKSDQWHAEAYKTHAKSMSLVWESLVCACAVSGVEVEPLTSSDCLIAEGVAMQHCVSTYDTMCMGGKYRIFSLKERSGERTTLGLARVGDCWSVDQHFSAANGSISASALAVGKEIERLYTKAEQSAQKGNLTEPDIAF